MEISKHILTELNQLSPLLAGMQKANVFRVPEGYFERLAEDIFTGIHEEGNNFLTTVPNYAAAQQVPQGYFESLAGTILNKIKTEESAAGAELKTISPTLYSIPGKNVFTVPQGYFESLQDDILDKINQEETATAELNNLSPALYNIQKKNVYTVPGNYFETLSDKIANAVQPQQAKLVTMRKRMATILKYAVAAVFTGVIALGIYKFTGNKTEIDPVVAQGMQIASDNKFDDELAKLTDTDIVNYLENSSSDVDAALVAGSIDENELPTADDYLTDDKALENYLNNIDVNDLKN